MNNLFNILGNNQSTLGNFGPIINQLKRFQSTFRGNPKAQVQQLLNSGRVTQDQYNQAVQLTNQLHKLIHG